MANVHSAARAAPLGEPSDRPVPSPGPGRSGPVALAQLNLHAVPRSPTSRREAWLLAGLAAALHGGVLYWAMQTPTPVLPVVPPEIPPMTIEFSRPAPPVEAPPPVPPPPPPPVVEPPPPPVVDELAAKPAPKPVPKPKPVVKPPPKAPPPEAAKPTPAPPPVAPAPAPVAAPPAPPAPAPVTPPSASAGYLKNPAPEYPALAQRRNWEGTVLLRVHVLPSGSPAEIQVQQSAGRQQLDDAAVAAVKRWSFVPAKQGGQPVEGWVTVPIDFKIR